MNADSGPVAGPLDHSATRSLSASTLLRLFVRLYQHTLGLVLPNSCRYHPTCSQYALDALAEYGAVRGTWLAVRRVARCHPFATGGYDPIPLNCKRRTTNDERRSSDSSTEQRTTAA